MAKKKAAAAAKRKQCPICKMEVDIDAVNCPGCNARFDDSPQGATAAAPPEDESLPDDEAAPNGEESEESEAEEADA